MKSLSVIIVTIFALIMPAWCFALDICELGDKALGLTDVEYDKLFKDKVEDRTVKGTVTVLNVQYGISTSDFIIIGSCSRDVRVYMKSSSLGVDKLKQGQIISFSGTCTRLERVYGQWVYGLIFEPFETDRYILITIRDASVTPN